MSASEIAFCLGNGSERFGTAATDTRFADDITEFCDGKKRDVTT
jgi:hypothetical protein